MKHCKTCACDEIPAGITVFPAQAGSHYGSCNFCDRNIGKDGLIDPYQKVVLGGAGLQARICECCLKKLKEVTR